MPADDIQNSHTPAHKPEVREDFEKTSRPSTPGGSLPVYADYESEKAVIASLLADPDSLKTVMPILSGVAMEEQKGKKKNKGETGSNPVYHQIASVMFRDPKLALIYEAILTVNANQQRGGWDILTVSDHLQRSNRLAVLGGMDYLLQLQSSIPSTANLEGWCATLQNYAMLREIIRVCNHALDVCRNPENDVTKMLDEIESSLFSVRNSLSKADSFDAKPLMKRVLAHFIEIFDRQTEVGISTGYPDLDRLLSGGFRKQEMIVLAARPSIGKTAFALNIVRNIIMKQVDGAARRKVAFFSLEMSAEQVGQRLLCTEAQIPLSDIIARRITPADLKRLGAAASNISKAELKVDPTGGLSVFELRSKARKIKEQNGLDLIVIDYLTLMRADVSAADGRQVEVAAISGGLKKIAKDLDVPVLVLAQLNRDVEKGQGGQNARPKLSNLRESGAIEQDADVVMFLHRERNETKDLTPEAERNGTKAELIVEKNRNGATGIAELRFFAKLMEFRSVDHKYEKSDASV